MRTLLRFGLGVCLWIFGVFFVVVGGVLSGQGHQDGPKALLIFGGGWLMFYLLYRFIGSHWDKMRNTGKTLSSLACFAIFTLVGCSVSLKDMAEGFLVVGGVVLAILFVACFFAGGGGAYLPGGSAEREGMIKADLIGINNALNEIKKKL